MSADQNAVEENVEALVSANAEENIMELAINMAHSIKTFLHNQ